MTQRSSTTIAAQTAAEHTAEVGAFALDEDRPDEEDYQNENDENSAPPPIADAAISPQHRVLTQNFAEHGSRLGSLNRSGHRRSSLSMSSLPLTIDRDRNVTPPPSDSRWLGAFNGGQSPDDLLQQQEEASPHALASAQRARKRLRTSAEMSDLE